MKSVILLSGGLDSSVLLACQCNERAGEVVAVTVDYGQRHRREMWSAFQMARYYGATHEVVSVTPEAFHGSALTKDSLPVLRAAHHYEGDCTVVPGRNLVLLSIAVASAVRHRAPFVSIASSASDRVVYPDCREEFFGHVNAATVAAYGVGIRVPFVNLTKKQIVEVGRELGVPIGESWSCYNPQNYDPNTPASGVPCGKCGACVLRAEALS